MKDISPIEKSSEDSNSNNLYAVSRKSSDVLFLDTLLRDNDSGYLDSDEYIVANVIQ